MMINWLLIFVLFGLSLPGVFIAIPRIISFLLPESTDAVKKRFTLLASGQTLFIVLLMVIAGAVLSPRTGLKAPLIESILAGQFHFNALSTILLPTLIGALVALAVFFLLYYGLISRIVDEQSLKIMSQLRGALGVSGCILYGGVVEELIARWGLMNLTAFFILMFISNNPNVMWISIVLSGLLYAVGQVPAYLAAGCLSTRPFIYSFVAISLSQSLIFGYLFWQYGLLSAMLAHMIVHLGWSAYDKI